MVDWNVGSGGGLLVFDRSGGLLLLLIAAVVLYLTFQVGFWIGRSVGIERGLRADRRQEQPRP